jgi:hypothetical protein
MTMENLLLLAALTWLCFLTYQSGYREGLRDGRAKWR